MQIGKGRPLAVFCWILTMISAICMMIEPSSVSLLICFFVAFAAVAILITLGFLFSRRRYLLRYLAFLTSAALLSVGCAYARQKIYVEPAQQFANSAVEQPITILGTVVSEEYYSDYLTCVGVKMELVDESGNTIASLPLYLNLTGSHDTRIGDHISATARIYTVDEAPEDLHARQQLRSQGYLLVGYVDSVEDIKTLSKDEFVLERELGRLQLRLYDKLANAVTGEEGDLTAALLLGMREDLSGMTVLNFRRAGASHLLALSGLHLSLIMLLLTAFLRAIRCPFYWRLALSTIVALSFLLLTGCSVSMLRATFMLLCLYLSRLRGSPHDSLTSLSVFLGVTLTVTPYAVYDAGLWLTVLATFALIEVIPALMKKTSASKKQSGGKRVLFCLWNQLLYPTMSSVLILYILLFPMALIFGEISLLSPLSNLLLTPLTAICLGFGICYFVMAYLATLIPFSMPLAAWIAKALYAISGWMLDITAWMSDLRGALISLRYKFVMPLLLILLLTLFVFLLLRWKHPRRYFAVLASWSVAFIVCFAITRSVVTSGQWQATYQAHKDNELLCFSQNETAILCDITDGSYGVYREFLVDGKPSGATELDGLILTHYHNRHISTVYKLLGSIKIRTIYLPLTMPEVDQEKAQKDESILRSIASLARERDVSVQYYLPKERISLTETLSLECLHYSMLERSTHPTISMTWQYQNGKNAEWKRLVWLGASSWESEKSENVLTDATAANVLIFANHGPKIKSDYELKDFTVQPELWLFADGNASVPLQPTPEATEILGRLNPRLGNNKINLTLP